jgi:hypothetical protein
MTHLRLQLVMNVKLLRTLLYIIKLFPPSLLPQIASIAMIHQEYIKSNVFLQLNLSLSPYEYKINKITTTHSFQFMPTPVSVWYCCRCQYGPLNPYTDYHCASCGAVRCSACVPGYTYPHLAAPPSPSPPSQDHRR